MTERSPTGWLLSCDWGTSTFRLYLVNAATGEVLASVKCAEGVNALHQTSRAGGGAGSRDEIYSSVFRRQMKILASLSGQKLDGLPVVVSGMATASIGWREIPYLEMPFALDGSGLRIERLDPQPPAIGSVLLVSGARTAGDMMRGEEIQVTGAVAVGARPDALFVLPGTHSKHVRTNGKYAVDLRTYMTGEFFELLARQSILVHSIEDDAEEWAGTDRAFNDGVKAGAAENLLHASFGVRVAQLDARRDRREGWRYLSGLVTGAELREVAMDPETAIALVGSPAQTSRYNCALRTLGHRGSIAEYASATALIAGHIAVARRASLIA
jgi:2-dehydro-3-deoxygalactonokinase